MKQQIILFLAACSFVFGSSCRKPCPEKVTTTCEQPCIGRPEKIGEGPGQCLCSKAPPPSYNTPARIDIACGWDVFTSVSFIYWHARQQGMELARFRDFTGESTLVTQDFEYTPGFKVAMGASVRHDDWQAVIEYTRLHGSTRTDFFITSDEILNPSLRPTSLLEQDSDIDLASFKSKWTNHLDIIDLSLLRPYYQGKMLMIKPSIGLRLGRIKQKLDSSEVIVDIPEFTFARNQRSKSEFIGPRAAFDMMWELGRGVRIDVTGAFALLYQKNSSKLTGFDSAPAQDFNIPKASNRDIVPNADLGLGLGWGSYFIDSRMHFDLLASYDFNYFWNQNTLRVNDATSFRYHKPGDLMYHGLTIKTRFDY